MVDVPPEVAIKATIRPGSVYYFTEESFSSTEPHYFVVLNTDPLKDRTVIFVCASSKIEKVKRRRPHCPSETLVIISPVQYAVFKCETIIDCNTVFEKPVELLVEKLTQGKLQLKDEMAQNRVSKLREGVIASPLIEGYIKELLMG